MRLICCPGSGAVRRVTSFWNTPTKFPMYLFRPCHCRRRASHAEEGLDLLWAALHRQGLLSPIWRRFRKQRLLAVRLVLVQSSPQGRLVFHHRRLFNKSCIHRISIGSKVWRRLPLARGFTARQLPSTPPSPSWTMSGLVTRTNLQIWRLSTQMGSGRSALRAWKAITTSEVLLWCQGENRLR